MTSAFATASCRSRRMTTSTKTSPSTTTKTASMVAFVSLLLALSAAPVRAQPDRFNYFGTTSRPDQGTDYGVEDWGQIQCNHGNLDDCIGYTNDWEHAVDWKLRVNSCKWCPDDDQGNSRPGCNRHHQSPVHLFRDRAINGTQFANYCIDIHWMQYGDSTCTWDHLVEKRAFSIERHALRVAQPLYQSVTRGWEPDCVIQGRGRLWGRIDFSRGFPAWWFLSHIDFHVPSEHMQDGKRYSGELHMYHFYSKPAPVDNPNRNELASVSVFMEEYDDAAPWDYLDRLICQWRREEEFTRAACSLPQIRPAYPGCFEPDRDATTQRGGRNLRRNEPVGEEQYKRRNKRTAMDIILSNREKEVDAEENGNVTALDHLETLYLHPDNFRPPDDIDWDAFIADQSASMKRKEALYAKVHRTNQTEADEYDTHNRHLLAGESLFWLNHFPLISVKTEYYYRYEGTMTTPPCYGPQSGGTRANTTHWRVMKDPIRVHKRQIKELKRLQADRIAPADDPIQELRCQPDTAAKVTRNGDEIVDVSTARPLQAVHPEHVMMFCECERWPSKWPEDREWCKEDDQVKRFYDSPYNFHTDGF